MKILFCHNHYRQRSGEDIAFDLARDLLIEGGHEVVAFTRHCNTIQGHSSLGMLSLAAQTPYSPRTRREVYNVARRERPDVALVQNVFPLLSPSIFYGLAEAGVPAIQMVFNYRMVCANGQLYANGRICERCLSGISFHGVLQRCYRQSYTFSALYSFSLAMHKLLHTWHKHVRFFVVPDTFLGNKLIEAGFPADRMRKVTNPFRVDDYAVNYRKGDYALFVGRLIRPKGVQTLLDACLQLHACRVVIVGAGVEWESMRQHPAVLQGKAELLGEVYGEELKKLIAHSSFVIVPSEWYDNLPMIVCQAFASGKPVIASRINGIPEFVKHEQNGLTFPPGDAAALATEINRLWNDDGLH